MAYARGTFGIEYTPRKPEEGSGFLKGCILVVILIVLVLAGYRGVRSLLAPRVPVEALEEEPSARALSEQPRVAEPVPAQPAVILPPSSEVAVDAETLQSRPTKLQNLLMKLEEAEKMRNVELAVNTIERIRALPGNPAADLDDQLARRLGEYNVQRLFNLKYKRWVTEVTVKAGDSATRIAIDHGSTLASLQRLNGSSLDKLRIGQKLFVIDHLQFTLVVHKKLKVADLMVRGVKAEDAFFARFDLLSSVKAEPGVYETGAQVRPSLVALGLTFKANDRTLLESLLPRSSRIIISEM